MIAGLICAGHVNAWNYTYTFAKAAIESVKEYEKRQVKGIALGLMKGLDLALAKNRKKAVEEFLKEPEKDGE